MRRADRQHHVGRGPKLVRHGPWRARARWRASITPSPMRKAVTGACRRSASSRTSFDAPCAPPPTMISGRSAFASSAAASSISVPVDRRECAARPWAAHRSARRWPTCRSAPRCPTGRGRPETRSVRIACIAGGASDALSMRREFSSSCAGCRSGRPPRAARRSRGRSRHRDMREQDHHRRAG